MITNHPHGTLYIGVTNSLGRRIRQHKTGMQEGFSKRSGLKHLVYFEGFREVRKAITRETEFKGWLRRKKIDLIVKNNPRWSELAADWTDRLALDSSLRSE